MPYAAAAFGLIRREANNPPSSVGEVGARILRARTVANQPERQRATPLVRKV
jgi:hypothetical protein